MSTRSLTRIYDGNEEICGIYRHHDGYPEGHGKDLVAMLSDKRVVNGFCSAAKLPKAQRLNGAGRVAAFIVAELHDRDHEPNIMPPGAEAGQSYEYHVKCPGLAAIDDEKNGQNYDGLPIEVTAFGCRGGWGSEPKTLEPVPLPSEERVKP